MIARKRIKINTTPEVDDDFDALREKNAFGWAMAVAMLKVAATGHKPKDVKWGRLEGLESIAFQAHQKDDTESGRLIFRRAKEAVEIIAVSDDHDDAYRKARARVKPKA